MGIWCFFQWILIFLLKKQVRVGLVPIQGLKVSDKRFQEDSPFYPLLYFSVIYICNLILIFVFVARPLQHWTIPWAGDWQRCATNPDKIVHKYFVLLPALYTCRAVWNLCWSYSMYSTFIPFALISVMCHFCVVIDFKYHPFFVGRNF
jgi:hypothetical protein